MAKSKLEQELSPLTKSLIEGLIGSRPVSAPSKGKVQTQFSIEPIPAPESKEPPSLVKSVLNMLNGGENESIERLAFEVDPSRNNSYQALYRAKNRMIPDSLLKRITIQDDLVASIVGTRANQLSAFGRPRPNRHEIGFVIDPNPGVLDSCSPDQEKELRARIDKAIAMVKNCGSTRGWSDDDQLTFSQYLYMSTRNAVTVGRIATEIVHVDDVQTGKKVFHSFRPIDAGTIYKAVPQKNAAQAVRDQAFHLLEQIKNKKLEPEKFKNDEYTWVQVIEAKPMQAFTSEECLVHNFYPVTDIELDGYPLTPIDTAIAAVTTHINITTHNKLYFQNGRAAKGMLILKSDDVDEGVIARIRQQFNASINSVSNSWRMPVFGVGQDDDINWAPIDNSSRDMEYQYLSDSNARVLLSAFQMSPEELPGYAHLSRGTNSQALSESNQEYKLEAHRDVGIRPLIRSFEDFLNARILPLIDEQVARLCSLKLVGLDAETSEKESLRIQQDQAVHMTYDEVLQVVEKDPIGKAMGGEFPINPQYQAILDKYLPVGQILEHFFGVKGASKDPQFQYVRDQFWFTKQQMMQAEQQAQQQAQMQQQQLQAQQQQGQQPPQEGQQEQLQQAPEQGQGSDLSRSLDQALVLLTKSEDQLPPGKKRILKQHQATISNFLEKWQEDVDAATKEILGTADKYLHKK